MSELSIYSTEQDGLMEQHHGHDETRSSWVSGGVFMLLIVLGLIYIFDKLYHPERFQIEQIEVHGQFDKVNGEQIKLQVERSLMGNYFSADLVVIENSVKKMPWVFDATVRRQWPSTLLVEIEEVQPIATWDNDQWLNSSGDLVLRVHTDIKLPILSGPKSMQQEVWRTFSEWRTLFATHGLSLDRLEFDERELWYMTLSLTALALDRIAVGGDMVIGEAPVVEVTMIVDNADARARIDRLINALNAQLIAEFPRIKSIDLRYPNGFAINWVEQKTNEQKLTKN